MPSRQIRDSSEEEEQEFEDEKILGTMRRDDNKNISHFHINKCRGLFIRENFRNEKFEI